MWDFACPYTLSINHLHRASVAACTVTVDAEDRKRAKYAALCDQYCIGPLAHTLAALGEEAATFSRDFGRRIAAANGESRSTFILFQRLSIATQRGNAASVVGTSSRAGLDYAQVVSAQAVVQAAGDRASRFRANGRRRVTGQHACSTATTPRSARSRLKNKRYVFDPVNGWSLRPINL